MVIVFFGPPGSGKGTQSRIIGERFALPVVSAGDLLRAELASLPEQAAQTIRSGGLVPDDLVARLVGRRLSCRDARRGFILDGFPRSVSQARFLDNLLETRNLSKPTIVHLDVPEVELIRRAACRTICPSCGATYSKPGVCSTDGAPLIRRTDDSAGVILDRLQAFRSVTAAVLEHYADGAIYHRIDASRSIAEVSARLMRLLDPKRVMRHTA